MGVTTSNNENPVPKSGQNPAGIITGEFTG